MNWLQFFSSVIGSLAWPVTVVVAFYFLKSHIADLFPFVERLKLKDFEVEFRKSVQELAVQSRAELPTAEIEGETTSPKNRLYSLAEISPRSAILEAWLQVEAASADVIQSHTLSVQTKLVGISPLRLGEQLNRLQLINSKQLEIFQRLRELRNKAVHIGDATFPIDEVLEYIDLATSLAAQIRSHSYGSVA
jgi:hypothetical protein